MCAGQVLDVNRAKGYTIVAKSEFANLEDLNYYDDDCVAHKKLKTLATGLGMTEPPTTLFFEGSPIVNIVN